MILTVIAAHSVLEPPPSCAVWSVDGVTYGENERPMPVVEVAQFTLDPAPFRNVGREGFHFDFATKAGATGAFVYPTMIITRPNFEEIRINLEPGHPVKSKDLDISWDTSKQRINIKKVVIHKLPEYDGSGQPPAPIGGVPE